MTDADIRIEPLLGNLNTLFPLRGKPAQSEFSVQAWLSTFGPVSVPFSVAEAELGQAFLLRLLANDSASCDLHQPLAGDTVVTINRGGEQNATCLF